ncbi:hypothetical protein B0H17DRAFT_1291486 [Mycena rosella]|uniref:Uncharacterized protein n=1 Tax=Mycena rosella TaxID=1033263 RepID=A0AAD7GDZ4_MYCRO|nr:hypothetical protein B0H17DRAFT_1291486 [Mycena rosella]
MVGPLRAIEEKKNVEFPNLARPQRIRLSQVTTVSQLGGGSKERKRGSGIEREDPVYGRNAQRGHGRGRKAWGAVREGEGDGGKGREERKGEQNGKDACGGTSKSRDREETIAGSGGRVKMGGKQYDAHISATPPTPRTPAILPQNTSETSALAAHTATNPPCSPRHGREAQARWTRVPTARAAPTTPTPATTKTTSSRVAAACAGRRRGRVRSGEAARMGVSKVGGRKGGGEGWKGLEVYKEREEKRRGSGKTRKDARRDQDGYRMRLRARPGATTPTQTPQSTIDTPRLSHPRFSTHPLGETAADRHCTGPKAPQETRRRRSRDDTGGAASKELWPITDDESHSTSTSTSTSTPSYVGTQTADRRRAQEPHADTQRSAYAIRAMTARGEDATRTAHTDVTWGADEDPSTAQRAP